MVLCQLLESRGHEDEVCQQATTFVNKLHGKLIEDFNNCNAVAKEETRGQILMATRILGRLNAIPVIDSLLSEHKLPYDEAMVIKNHLVF